MRVLLSRRLSFDVDMLHFDYGFSKSAIET